MFETRYFEGKEWQSEFFIGPEVAEAHLGSVDFL